MKKIFAFIVVVLSGLLVLKMNQIVNTDISPDINFKSKVMVEAESKILSSNQLIDILQVDNSIVIDLKYATSDNFLKHKLYSDNHAKLLPHVADALAKAQQEFLAHGVSIKVWDAYRPLRVQEIMWHKLPDERYVSNPAKGGRHTRGTAVDLTLVDATTGEELKMPTAFDNFTSLAHRDVEYSDAEIKRNYLLLDSIMIKHGFVGLQTEWWHYDIHDWQQFEVIQD